VKALYALALVIFAAATPPALWPGALVFIALWALFPRWRVYLAWLAGVFALYLFCGSDPHDAAEMKRLALLAGRLALGLLAFAWSAALAENDSYLAPVPFLLWALLSRPGGLTLGLSLLAWVSWQLVRQQRQSRELGREFKTDARAALATGAFLLGSLLLLASVGGPAPFAQKPSHPPAVAERTIAGQKGQPATSAEQPATTSQRAEPATPKETVVTLPGWLDFFFRSFNRLISAALVLTLGLLLALWWRLLKVPSSRRHIERGSVLLVLLAIIGVSVGVLIFAFAFPGEGGFWEAAAQQLRAGGTAPVASGAASQTVSKYGGWLGPLLVVGGFSLLALILLLAYTIFRLLRSEPQAAAAAAQTPPAGRRTPEFAGRVRAAYREFLRLMLGHAPVRRSETPREYASRLEKRFAEIAVWVGELTDLYEPVRYGGLADEEEAERAEKLVRQIAAALEREREET